MRVNLIKVGNSTGIIIPAAILSACELKDAVDLQVKGKKLEIAALKQPRTGWFSDYKPEQDKEDVLAGIPLDEDTDEWQW